MANLRDIKKRIGSVQGTSQITRTMEMVATAKIRKAQERIEAARPFALAMVEVLENVARFVQDASHPLLEEHAERKNVAIVSIASDRGMCGAFNSNILRMSEDIITRESADGVGSKVIAVGKKAITYFRYRGHEPAAAYRDISDKPSVEEARSIAEHIVPAYIAGEIDAAYIVFSRFFNVANQKAEVYQLLPIERHVMQSDESEIDELLPEYLFEPTPEAVLERLLPTYVETLIYRALMESAASEQGARRTAMKLATDNASDMVKTLTRSYNRARQAAITQEIAEIVGGASALEDS